MPGSGDPATTDYIAEMENGEEPTAEVETLQAIARRDALVNPEKRNRILRLRRDGFTYEQIADAISKGQDGKEPIALSAPAASQAVNRYVREMAEQDTDTVQVLRSIDNDRLERMFRRLEAAWIEATTLKEKDLILARQLRVLERKAKLNGLDAPQRHEISGGVNLELLANPDHVAKVEEEFHKRFADYELPPADVVEEPA